MVKAMVTVYCWLPSTVNTSSILVLLISCDTLVEFNDTPVVALVKVMLIAKGASHTSENYTEILLYIPTTQLQHTHMLVPMLCYYLMINQISNYISLAVTAYNAHMYIWTVCMLISNKAYNLLTSISKCNLYPSSIITDNGTVT